MTTIDRTKGKYPVSIGTSTALESFFGVSDTQPAQRSKPPYTQYQCIVANVRTLIRNYLSSYKAIEVMKMSVSDLYSDFVKELILISNVISDQSRNNIVFSVYDLTHIKLERKLRKAVIKTKYTTKQQYMLTLEDKLAALTSANTKLFVDYFNYEITSDTIKHGARRNVIITHYPMDLLFTALEVDLLESHTGKVKKSFEFNTKLKKAPEDAPFNIYTLQIFGDSSGFILPYSSAMRNELSEICEKSSAISPVMQDRKFIKAVKRQASPELSSLLNSI